MSPELWHQISIVFLVIGIVFLILTIIFSVKFQLLSIIRTEFNSRKNKKFTGDAEYFAYVENKNRSNQPEERSLSEGKFDFRPDTSRPGEVGGAEAASFPDGESTATVLTSSPRKVYGDSREELSSATVLTSSSKRRAAAFYDADETSSPTEVLSPEDRPAGYDADAASGGAEQKNNMQNDEYDFVISENIMMIHGDPGLIRRHKTQFNAPERIHDNA